MKPTVLSRVRRIGADVFSVSIGELAPEASPETVGQWDSLQHLNLVLALEQEFEVQIVPEEIERMDSIQAITKLIEQKLQVIADS